MKFKFWARLKDANRVDLAEADKALRRARERLNSAKCQQDESRELKRRADRTRQINHWSNMMETAWADRPRE
jgi:hypothetical protein